MHTNETWHSLRGESKRTEKGLLGRAWAFTSFASDDRLGDLEGGHYECVLGLRDRLSLGGNRMLRRGDDQLAVRMAAAVGGGLLHR